jgi:hypothetical protein
MATNKPTLTPSSGTNGFFQEPPKLKNLLEDDVTLHRILNCEYLPLLISNYKLLTMNQ